MTTTLTWPQVLAWRLKRQHLGERVPRASMLEMVSDICGLHAQVLSAAKLAVWARVADATPEDVAAALWQDRSLVKLWVMRGTLHLLPADDLPLYVAAGRATRVGHMRASWYKYFGITPQQQAAIYDAVSTVLSDQPLTRTQLVEAVVAQTGLPELGQAMLSGWGTMLKPASYHGNLCFGPSQGQNVTFVQPRRWLNRELEEVEFETAMAAIIRRYLSVYGPASIKDFANWWGLEAAKSKKLIRSLGDELVEVEVEGWRGWLLADDMAEVAATTPELSVRLLPLFDPYTVAANRGMTAIVPAEHKSRIYRIAGWISPVLLINGAVAGVWQHTQQRDHLAVQVEPFVSLTAEIEQRIAAEAASLGRFFNSEVQLTYGKLTAIGGGPGEDGNEE